MHWIVGLALDSENKGGGQAIKQEVQTAGLWSTIGWHRVYFALSFEHSVQGW